MTRLESLAVAVVGIALAWLLCPSHYLWEMSWRSIFVAALGYVALVFEGTVLAGRLWAKISGREIDPLGPAESAIWAAPLAVFSTASSAWTPLIALIAAGALTLRFQLRIANPTSQKVSSHAAGIAIQLALAAAAIDATPVATALCVGSAVVLAARWANDHREPRAMWRTLAGATLLVTLGLLQYHLAGGSSGGQANTHAAPPVSEPGTPAPDADRGALELDDSHIGVILLPEQQKHTMLIAPLPALGRGWKATRDPLSIPFFGAYWFYKAPNKRPPARSHVTRGKASDTSFRSADRRPLLMEARQHLGVFLDTACCRELRIEVGNADRYPGTVALEVSLIDSARLTAFPLGRRPVTSTPHWRPGDDGRPLPEVILFAMPGVAGRFDEIAVRFHLEPVRAGRSAKIAIERFVLAP